MLALVIFINRSGTMVVPFLSIYLTTQLGFTLAQMGWVLSMFGIGAIGGSVLGGWLTDKIGHFKVQTISLIGGGSMFFVLSQVEDYEVMLIAIFFVSLISEMLRPANQSSVASYAKPENVTRAFSLNRMAINLGFSFGPALGGILAGISYKWLFIADGLTCIAAGVVFFFYFRNRKSNVQKHSEEHGAPKKRVWRDYRFLVFVFLVVIYGTVFFQLFMTWPLYQRTVFQLPESQIGLLIGINGFIVFLFEMILVYVIGDRLKINRLIAAGSLLSASAFFFLFGFDAIWVLFAAVILISFSEILAMPFMATFTVTSSSLGNRGSYMGLYSMAFASAFVLAPAIGSYAIGTLGFTNWWFIAGCLATLNALAFYFVLREKRSS